MDISDLLSGIGEVVAEEVVESVVDLASGDQKEEKEDKESVKITKNSFSDYLLIVAIIFICMIFIGGFGALIWLFVF